ncbi:MAG TPA: hypothetical protein VGV57_11255, partial [Thermoleophilaceae bacterium]|nr:hypothetical protein [Thermoleophilaceae bacterium]
RRGRPAARAPRARAGPPGAGALMPALPLETAGKYVAAAYILFLALVVIYVAIIGRKVGRLERELSELDELTRDREQ